MTRLLGNCVQETVALGIPRLGKYGSLQYECLCRLGLMKDPKCDIQSERWFGMELITADPHLRDWCPHGESLPEGELV